MTDNGLVPVGLRHVDKSAPASEIAKIVAQDGAVIIREFLSPAQVERFNAEVGPALAAVSPGGSHEDPLFQEFHGVNTKRMTNLTTLSRTFRVEVLDDDVLHALGEAVFREESGDWWLTSGQVIEIGPGNRAQFLHRDLENYPPFVPMGSSAPEVIANLFIALSPFTDANGATRILPGSHLSEDYTDRGSPEQTIPAEMNPGDAAFFAGKVLHGGGANRTTDQYRRAVSVALQPSYLTPEEAHPLLIDREVAMQLPPRVQKILGFRSQYPLGNPGLWLADYGELATHLTR